MAGALEPVPDDTAESYAGSALRFIETELPGIDALSAMLNQRTRPSGDLYTVMDVGWRMLPELVNLFAETAPDADNVRQHSGVTQTTFYSHPDASKDWQTIVLHEIVVKASKILSIYAGLSEVHKLPDPDVPTVILRGAPTAIQQGETVTLTWETTNAIRVEIEPDIGVVAANGVTEVTPQGTTTYRLTAVGWLDTVVDTVLVTVTPSAIALPPPPPPVPPPLPPPPPGPTIGGVWLQDATNATVKPNSDALVQAFLTYCGPLAYFVAEVGTAVVEPDTPTYSVSTAGKIGALDDPLHIPVGAKPGLSNDHHLLIIDRVRNRWHDLELFNHALVNGRVTDWSGGVSMPIGATQEPAGGSATAAKFPLRAGGITIEDVQAGGINHPLVFSAANLGPAPNPYPAASQTGYKTGNSPMGSSVVGHIPLGTRMRLNPQAVLPATLTPFARMVAVALQRWGMYCRDRGSTLAIHGIDPEGGGASIPAWQAAGVPLNAVATVRLSGIPWHELQVLEPPARQ